MIVPSSGIALLATLGVCKSLWYANGRRRDSNRRYSIGRILMPPPSQVDDHKDNDANERDASNNPTHDGARL